MAIWATVIPLAFQTACKKAEDATSASSATSTVANPPVGVVSDNLGFYIRAKLDNRYTYITHEASSGSASGFAKPCAITDADIAAGKKDIICYVEGEELDLAFQGVSLQHNVPSTMCKYFEVAMPYYFKFPAGYGPDYVESISDNDNKANIDVANSVDGVPWCAYNHTLRFAEAGLTAPNCCDGSSKYNLFTSTISGGVQSPATPTKGVSWGGTIGDCLSGPAIDLQKRDRYGFPRNDIYFVDNVGLNGLTSIRPTIDNATSATANRALVNNEYVANFFYPDTTVPASTSSDTLANFNNPARWPVPFAPAGAGASPIYPDRPPGMGLTGSAMPMFGNAATGPAGTNGVAGSFNHLGASYEYSGKTTGYIPWKHPTNPFYDYQCLDRNHDIVARIRVLIRSWDTTGKITKMVADSTYGFNTTADAPAYGFSTWKGFVCGGGAGCESSPFGNYPLHDYGIWEDMKSLNGANYMGIGPTTYDTGYPEMFE